MRIIASLPMLFLVSLVGLNACSKKPADAGATKDESPEVDGSGAGSEPPGSVKISTDTTGLEGLTASALNIPEMLPPVVDNAPGALKISTGASLTSFAIDCSDSYAACAPGADQTQCYFIADVKCRFFSDDGPTQIKQILGNLDRTMVEFEKRSAGKYVPCLDPVGNKDGLTVKDHDQTTTVAPFDSVPFDTKFTGLKDKNDEAKELDLGFTFELNCIVDANAEKSTWTAVGLKKDKADRKIYTLSSMNGEKGERNGSVGTIDDDNNVDYWGIVSEGGKTSTTELKNSNVLMHLKSNADAKTIELSFTGTNVGPGCGMRMITTKEYLLAQANMNAVGQCEAGDTGYQVGKDAQTYCLEVDADDPVVTDEAKCTTAGLTAASFTRAALASTDILPFEIYKLFPSLPGVPEYVTFDLPKGSDKSSGEQKPATE